MRHHHFGLGASQTMHLLDAPSSLWFCRSSACSLASLQRSAGGLHSTANGCTQPAHCSCCGEELGPFTSLSFPNSLLPPSFPLSRATSFFLCLANDSDELGWWMIYIKGKKTLNFFFFFLNWAPWEHSGLPRPAQRLPAQLQGNKLLKALMGFCLRLFY